MGAQRTRYDQCDDDGKDINSRNIAVRKMLGMRYNNRRGVGDLERVSDRIIIVTNLIFMRFLSSAPILQPFQIAEYFVVLPSTTLL